MIEKVNDGCFFIGEKEQKFVESLVESLTNPEEAKENFREIREMIVLYCFEDLMSGLLQLCKEIEERPDLEEHKKKIEKYARELTVLLDLKDQYSDACEFKNDYRFFGVFRVEETNEFKVAKLPLLVSLDKVQLLETLKNEVDNPKIGLEDFYRKIEERISAESFNSCIGYRYTDTFVDEMTLPQPEYDRWQAEIQAINEKYCPKLAKIQIDSLIKSEKASFLESVEKYVKVSSLEQSQKYFDHAFHRFLLFSHENVGWYGVKKSITQDLTFEINTNFCYGSNAYFCLTLVYKSIPITPFTFYNNYYYANFHDILRYTLKLHPQRENWYPLLTVIAEVYSLFSQGKEQEFIDQYIILELNELKSYLENIYSADFCKLEKMATENNSRGCLSEDFRNLEESEIKEFSCFPIDSTFLYKVTKITNSTQFLVRICQLIQAVKYPSDLVNYILKINKTLEPEIIQKYSDYGEVIFELKKQIKDVERLVEVKKNLIDPHKENISLIKKEFFELKERNAVEDDYRKEHPFLKRLETSYNSKYLELSNLKKKLDSFSNFRSLLKKNLLLAREGIEQFEKYNMEQLEKGS